MIDAEHVTFEYFRRDENGSVTEIVEAVKDLSMQVKAGEFIGILGCNGSGKSTFAKLLSALLQPSEGTITIAGMDTREKEHTWAIRKNAGMVFQNPDNQIIGTTVEEDVAFGPENLGMEPGAIEQRIAEALEAVGMTAYYQQSPGRLSGGQKQRIAIAGILAMHPTCMIFDESTAMLDPKGTKEVMNAVRALNQKQKITILYITHDMEEVVDADRLIIMHQGRLVMEGSPDAVFRKKDELKSYGLTVPWATEVAERLHAAGISCPSVLLHDEELLELICRIAGKGRKNLREAMEPPVAPSSKEDRSSDTEAMVKGLVFHHVSYEYNSKTAYAHMALRDVDLAIHKGEFIGLIGHTGSGKSTLIQHMNGLLKPANGNIFYEGKDIHEKGYSRIYLREKVGLVFQYPEYQLFADTVLEDVSFGPKNLNLPLLEVQQRAFQAIEAVGLEDSVYDLSPFELSGGQKRRVAIAGVLAMKPDFLILDEPTAGLDPVGKKQLLEMLKALHQKGMGILLISHNMEDIAEYAGRILVMEQGKIVLDGRPEDVFYEKERLRGLGLDIPRTSKLLGQLWEMGYPVNPKRFRMEDTWQELVRLIG